MSVQAVIFDLDGLLVDTEPLWVDVECRLFTDELGVALSPEDCAEATGLRVDEWVRFWFGRRPWSGVPLAKVEALLIDRMAAAITTQAQPMPGAHHAIEVARSLGVPLGIASSAPERLISVSLERLGVTDAFDAVASAEHEQRGKPDPAVYHRAARALGVDPACCVAVEDSPNGVRAARAAGMRCVAVPAPIHRDQATALADLVLGSLHDLTPAHLSPPIHRHAATDPPDETVASWCRHRT